MDDRQMRGRIHRAMDTRLSGVTGDPHLARRILAGAKGGKQVKRKLSAGLAIAMVLVMLAVTALAVATLREVAQMIAKTEQDTGNFAFWPLEKKRVVIEALADQGYIGEADALRQLREGGADEADGAADALIEAFTGAKADEIGFMAIMQAAWGPFDTWSDEDRAWYSAVMEDAGVESDGKTVYVLPDGEISKEQAVEIATNAIVEGLGIDEAVLANYNLVVNFQVPEFAEAGDEQPYWYVMYDAKENSPDNPFPTIELFVHPRTGALLESVEEIRENWANLPRRPDNALYQDIDAYYERARALGADIFEEWPLELRAAFSQDIAPRVRAIVQSGDLTNLMNCGSPDLSVILPSFHVYGVPDESAVAQEDAYAAATAALTDAFGVPAGLFPQYSKVFVYYDVTSAPVWRFIFNCNMLDARQFEDGFDDPALSICYRVEIDARTGEPVHIERFGFRLAQDDPTYRMKWF